MCNILTEFYLYSIVYIYLINSRLDVTTSVRHHFHTTRTLSPGIGEVPSGVSSTSVQSPPLTSLESESSFWNFLGDSSAVNSWVSHVLFNGLECFSGGAFLKSTGAGFSGSSGKFLSRDLGVACPAWAGGREALLFD